MSLIKNSLFKDLGPTINGSAIYIYTQGIHMSIHCCVFENNWVTSLGGSICFSYGQINISHSSFYRCYSSKNTDDDLGGNCIYIDRNEANLECISTNLCGESTSNCADSSAQITSCKTSLTFFNATYNYGCGGAQICSLKILIYFLSNFLLFRY